MFFVCGSAAFGLTQTRSNITITLTSRRNLKVPPIELAADYREVAPLAGAGY